MARDAADARDAVERCFRDRRHEMVLVLTRKFGAHRLDDIENALQTAAARALDRWPRTDIPPNPIGWLIVVARNLLIDAERHASLAGAAEPEVARRYYPDASDPPDEPLWRGPLDDDVLKMMIVCTHPGLSTRESAVIILRLICNLGVEEIGRGLLTTVAAVRKQMSRAKARIRELDIPFDLPPADELDARVDRLLLCLYLLYNEGYLAHVGDNLVRRDLCNEAERLVTLLLHSSLEDKGKVWALASLLSFQSSRAEARTGPEGALICIADQDRSLWDRDRIRDGLIALAKSTRSRTRSRYHLEAAIAACHATAEAYDDTDWERIREYYDDLAEIYPSPVVDLNRSVAILMTDGVEPAIELLREIERGGRLAGDYLLPALLGDFHRRAGRPDEARVYYERSLALTRTEPVQEFLLGQIETCRVD